RVQQPGCGRHAGRAVITYEVRARLARNAGSYGTIAGPAVHDGSGNRRIEDRIDKFVYLVLLIRFGDCGTGTAEEGVAGPAGVAEVSAVARERSGRCRLRIQWIVNSSPRRRDWLRRLNILS